METACDQTELLSVDNASSYLLHFFYHNNSFYHFCFQARVTIIFIVVYIAEMCLKVLASGLLLLPGAYLRHPMNVLDLGIIAFG